MPVDCDRVLQPVSGHSVRCDFYAEPAAQVVDAADVIRVVVGQKYLSDPPTLFEKLVYELIERGFPGAALNGCITHMPKGYASELTSHEGEDFLYLIEGEMLYEIDGKEYLLKAGDTLHFPASLPHRARNVGAGPARELWVGTTRIIKED